MTDNEYEQMPDLEILSLLFDSAGIKLNIEIVQLFMEILEGKTSSRELFFLIEIVAHIEKKTKQAKKRYINLDWIKQIISKMHKRPNKSQI